MSPILFDNGNLGGTGAVTMLFKDALREALRHRGLSVPKFAKDFGVERQTVYKWLKGHMPNRNNIISIRNYFGTDFPIISGEDSYLVENVAPLSQTKARVPLIDQANAGRGSDAVNPYPLGAAEDFLDLTFEVSRGTFALRLRGESMEPEFYEGEVVIIDPAVEPLLDDFVVVELLDTESDGAPGQWTFKQYRPRGFLSTGEPVFDLIPLNPTFPTITVSPTAPGRLVGTMVEHRRRRQR